MPGPGQPVPQDGEPVPGEPVPGEPVPGDEAGAGVSQGLSWSWDLDLETLLTVLNEPAPWNRPVRGAPGAPAADLANAGGQAKGDPPDGAEEDDDQEAIQEALIDAVLAGKTREVPIGAVAGRVAESLPPGPDLAGWLATTSPGELERGALPGVVASFRRLASWAQAGELAAVAEMASRSAAADDKIGVDDEGRPSWIPDEAAAQVSLALAMTRYGASWWTDLAVTLTWRLAATGAALTAGQIDLLRARLIAEATRSLDDDTARAVEAMVLPSAGDGTTSQLRAVLRRAVIAAGPEGADRRRQEAERRAKVSLYPDEDGTATLSGQCLPGTGAAAAMARISAMARALKVSGADGGMNLLRAQVLLGLLLGTLPCIPPAPDSPPDEPPPDDGYGDDPSGGRPGGTGTGSHPRPSDTPDGTAGRSGRARDGGQPSPDASPEPSPGAGPGPGTGADDGPGAESQPGPLDGMPALSDDDAPVPSDEDAPSDDSLSDPLGGDPAWAVPKTSGDRGDDDDDDWSPGALISPPTWSALPTLILPPGAGPGPPDAGPGPGRPPPGLLDLTLPWETLAGCSPEPGYLGRLGPVTPSQAREIADAAAGDPAVQWRVILTSRAGQAIAVTRVPVARVPVARVPVARVPVARVPAARAWADLGAGRGGPETGLAGRVTLTIPEDILVCPPPPEIAPGDILARALRAAGRAAAAAATRAVADAATGIGCAHTAATPGYRPALRLREYVVARDLTCRFPFCGQPAWRGDLDHTQPWDRGGLTCSCNLGPLCRHHHILKQHPDWQLIQIEPGIFQWTTSAGRTYTAAPDRHAA